MFFEKLVVHDLLDGQKVAPRTKKIIGFSSGTGLELAGSPNFWGLGASLSIFRY